MDTQTSTVRPLRLWPGVAAAVLLVLARFVMPLIFPDTKILGVLAGVGLALVILLWWVFFSRAPWLERLGAIVLMAVGLFATLYIVHPSIRGGMMGMMLPIYAIPGLALALVIAAVATRGLAADSRRGAIVLAVLLACGVWALLRTDGVTGDGASQITWRWTPTAEEILLAQVRDGQLAAPAAKPTAPVDAPAPTAPAPAPSKAAEEKPLAVKAATTPAESARETPVAAAADPVKARVMEWPGFRGPNRDGVIRGVRIGTDWVASPPVELWRRPVGPGWSSFAVRGELFYTQEQRGDNEVVACYRVSTGEPVWMHRDGVRFYESNGGAGPRSTPALSSGRVYTLGATGILNALDARTGAVAWTRNAATDAGVPVPGWGISGSPLVVGDLVVVAASGALIAYDSATGEQRWLVKSSGGSYSSPHLMTIDGVPQILMMGGSGVTSVAPDDGTVLWQHAWPGSPIVQPGVTADGDVVITTADMSGGIGTRRLTVARGRDGWTVDERWTTRGLKPYFNDFVVHEGHAFGFDGSILASIDLADGTRKWKGGRFGHGQLVLLPEQDLLLVLSEEGELALVSATPDKFTEVARFKAIEGKTWNHPVLAGDVLLVRNGEEMAAFRLPIAGR